MDHTHTITFDFHDPTVIADPYPIYARMRREQPLWLNPASGTWTVTRHADVCRVLDGAEFSNARIEELFARLSLEARPRAEPLREIFEPRLLFTEGDRHRRLRSLLMKGFTPGHLQTYSSLISERLDLLLRDLPEGQPVDLLKQVCAKLPGMVILALLGIRVDEQDRMRAWTDDIYAWMGHFPGSILERTQCALQAMEGLRGRLRAYIEEVRT
ncbi:MAG TPA: hypothetical protein DCE44_03930 [Verrucomicrobiales bacterium]|nr:hypothetical protein [Verrucomicrobiales bacterium]